MTLHDYRPDAMRCTRCSYCKWIPFDLVKSWRFAKGCPSVDHNHFHSYSGGGRLITYLSLLDGRSEITDRVIDIAFKCQLCGNCDVACKVCRYDMEVLAALHEFRAWLVEQGRVPPTYAQIAERFRTERNMVMRSNAERGAWLQNTDVKDLSREPGKVVFHPGCRCSFEDDLIRTARAALALLRRTGVDVGVVGSGSCCSGRMYHMGYGEDLQASAEYNLEAWEAAGVETLVTPCADCYHTFKRLYPPLGSTIEVLHIVEFVDRMLKEGRLAFSRTVPLRVTYHDPCHLGRQGEPYVPWNGTEKKIFGQAVVYDPPRPRYNGSQGVYDPPRDVLRAIPGVELIEMERNREAAWCCGAGGGVRDAYPDFNDWTARERLEEARATGAEALVTACPWCERNFLDVSGDTPLQILDVMDLVERTLEPEEAGA
jgi:Fe-S oxidoreductase